MQWQKVINDGVEKCAKQAYDLHKNLELPDVEFVGNQQFANFVYENLNFARSGLEYKTAGIPREAAPGAENTELFIHTFNQEDPVTDFVKDNLDLQHAIVMLNKQKIGKVVGCHVDYNRSIFNMCKQKNLTLIAKDIKKFIWFLEDQQIGQFFAVGNYNVSWKKGDIISWPWYMPHATANSSFYDRDIVFITAV